MAGARKATEIFNFKHTSNSTKAKFEKPSNAVQVMRYSGSCPDGKKSNVRNPQQVATGGKGKGIKHSTQRSIMKQMTYQLA